MSVSTCKGYALMGASKWEVSWEKSSGPRLDWCPFTEGVCKQRLSLHHVASTDHSS